MTNTQKLFMLALMIIPASLIMAASLSQDTTYRDITYEVTRSGHVMEVCTTITKNRLTGDMTTIRHVCP